jgi:hypothetical protein
MEVLLDDEVPVHYGFIHLHAVDEDPPDLGEASRGQRNGLCGGAEPGAISLITGLHTGRVPLTVRWYDREPAVEPEWEEVVEASFAIQDPELWLHTFDWGAELVLPEVGSLRARYCGSGLDEAHRYDEPGADRYLLAIWPAPPAPDVIVRQTSAYAAYWHRAAQETRQPTAEERAAEERARAERERVEAVRAGQAAADLDLQTWGGRRPSARLREVGYYAAEVARSHPDLVDAFEALDADRQREVTRWLARQAFERTGLDRVDWAAPALEALDRGLPLPAPFTDPRTANSRLFEEHQTTGVTHVFKADEPRAHTARRVGAAGHPGTLNQRGLGQRSVAVAAILSAVAPDPLRALVEAFVFATSAAGNGHDELVERLRQCYLPSD